MRVVVESPLKGDTRESLRYLLWCCRAVYLAGNEPIASHLGCPWFMDDAVANERRDGIGWSWMWLGDPHMFFTGFGMSEGMRLSEAKCHELGIETMRLQLRDFDYVCHEAWVRGEWPPHTEGFEVQR